MSDTPWWRKAYNDISLLLGWVVLLLTYLGSFLFSLLIIREGIAQQFGVFKLNLLETLVVLVVGLLLLGNNLYTLKVIIPAIRSPNPSPKASTIDAISWLVTWFGGLAMYAVVMEELGA